MIPVRNVYYMLAYAFQVLREQGYRHIATEEFENVADLCAAILSKGVAQQLKRGLGREYIPVAESISTVRGKIDLSESIRTNAIQKQQLVCLYDEFSVNFYLNRILKSTMLLLLHADIASERKKELRKVLVYLSEVETIDVYSIDWHIRLHRNNQTYRMLISVCHLVIKGLLQTKTEGGTVLMDFLDEQRMCRLYERFILEYYRQTFPALSAEASWIPWALDDGEGELLPAMRSDITLSDGNHVLIIDAKYYSTTMQTHFDKRTIHSNNLYQIFAYVKNRAYGVGPQPHEVSGMLLYAKTDEEFLPHKSYRMHGNRIDVRTLDLSLDFSEIAAQLDDIVRSEFTGSTSH